MIQFLIKSLIVFILIALGTVFLIVILNINNDHLWTMVSSLSAVISVFVALYTVYLSVESKKDELIAKRPYFIIENPRIQQLQSSPPFAISITMFNKGIHSAKKLKGTILFVKYDLTSKIPLFKFDFSVSNEIPSNSPTPWFNDSLYLPDNEPPCYIILSIEYVDSILNNGYTQEFFMKWSGVKDGEFSPNFVHTSIEEANSIKDFLSNSFLVEK